MASTGTPAGHSWSRGHVALLAAGLFGAALLRVALLPMHGMRGDLDLFASWVHRLATDLPLGRAYDLPIAFPPLMTYLFELMATAQPLFQTATDASDPWVRATLKIPASAADLGLALGVAAFLRDRPLAAITAALALAFLPVTWYLSAWWGQFESIYVLLGLIAALFALSGRWGLAAVALGLALSTKPQALPFIVPFAAWAVTHRGPRATARAGAVVALTIVVLWLPFIPAGGPLAYFANVAALQGGDFSVWSLNAWDFWWIGQETVGRGGFVLDDAPILGPLSPRVVGYAMTGLAWLVVFVVVARRPTGRALLLGLAAAQLAAYLLLTTMHERYSFAAVVLLLPVALGLARRSSDRWLVAAWCVMVVTASLNYIALAPPAGAPFPFIPLGGLLGLVASIAFCWAGIVILASLVFRRPNDRPEKSPGAPRRRAAGERNR